MRRIVNEVCGSRYTGHETPLAKKAIILGPQINDDNVALTEIVFDYLLIISYIAYVFKAELSERVIYETAPLFVSSIFSQPSV